MSHWLAWPVLGSLLSTVGTAALIWWLHDRRDSPGASWLLVALCIQFVLVGSTTVAFLVFDAAIRAWLEILFWVCVAWLGTTFLGFGLAYTGRSHLLRSPGYWFVLLVTTAETVLAATNPLHHFLFTEFRIDPVLGIATVSYTRQLLVLAIVVQGALTVAAGTLLLFDTVASYGPLYRREAAAVGLSTVAPAVGAAIWAFAPGPLQPLNLTAVLFFPHVLLDGYAFVRSDMFEFHPATRRAGERAAIDDIGNPVMVVDDDHRVVNLNDAAQTQFGVEKSDALTKPLDALYEGDHINPEQSDDIVSVRTDGWQRQFAVTATPLESASGVRVGFTVVLQDITRERQREQRLEVLNRILRHNLRNDLSVVRSTLTHVKDDVSDDELLRIAENKVTDLVELGTKARTAAEALGSDDDPRVIDLTSHVNDVVADVRSDYPDGEITVDVPPDLRVEARPRLVTLVIENIVENALKHGSAEPTVEIAVTDLDYEEGTVTLAIRDDGPGIPDHELQVIKQETETDLQHGSGLGLWVVSWGCTALGGGVSFDTNGDGTTVELWMPGLVESPERGAVDDAAG